MGEFDELDAMKQIAAALEALDDAARQRALQWALSRYRGGKFVETVAVSPLTTSNTNGVASQFQTFAELFNAANPNTEKEKALVAGYWAQICQGSDSFPSQMLNDELKNLGHRIGNITDALSQLKDERPALALQLKKSGTSKQARKIYKLTHEGIKRVETMIANHTTDSE